MALVDSKIVGSVNCAGRRDVKEKVKLKIDLLMEIEVGG